MMTNWRETCRLYENDIIEYAVNVAYLKMDARYFDKEEDKFVLVSLDSAEDMVEVYETKIRNAAKSLIAARTRVATEKNERTILSKGGMPFTPV